jgi:hypothetical protein
MTLAIWSSRAQAQAGVRTTAVSSSSTCAWVHAFLCTGRGPKAACRPPPFLPIVASLYVFCASCPVPLPLSALPIRVFFFCFFLWGGGGGFLNFNTPQTKTQKFFFWVWGGGGAAPFETFPTHLPIPNLFFYLPNPTYIATPTYLPT